MKEISGSKFQISASVGKETVKAITEIMGAENRKFSIMVDILLSEAVKARKTAENGSQGHSKNNKRSRG